LSYPVGCCAHCSDRRPAIDSFTIAILVSIAVYLVIGNYAGRGVKQLDDYFVAGRRAPTLLIVGTLVASVMSSTVFLGEAGFTYDGQMGPFLQFPQMATTGYVIGALLFGRYLRRSRAPTVAAFFGKRFASRRVQAVAGITIIVALGVYLVVVTQGAAILLSDLTPLSYTQGLLIAWFSYTAFTLYSGSRGVILTDTLMFLLFTGAAVFVAIYVVADLGGLAATIEGLGAQTEKPGIASWHGVIGPGTQWPTAKDYLIWSIIIDIGWGFAFAVSPWQSSRHLMARDEHIVLRAAIYTCIVVGLLQLVIYGTGGFINLANPDIEPSETVMIWASQNLVPQFLGALMLAGIMAAALSSASTFLSLVGFSASNDIVVHHERTEKRAIHISRLVMFGTGVVALLATFLFPPSIFWVTYFIGPLFASTWGPVAIMSVWSKRITRDGAFWGIIAGFVCNAVPWVLDFSGIIALPSYLDPILTGAVASLLVTIAVSRRGTVSREEHVYRMRLHRTPQEDLDEGLTRTTLVAPWVLIGFGCIMPFVMLHWYVRPYQRGAGQLLADGSINWATGEALLSLSWALLYIPLGLITYRVIRNHYSPRWAQGSRRRPRRGMSYPTSRP
jgi:sodium/pantothenate symporter